MTRSEIENILARFTYRRGWKVVLDQRGDIHVTARVRNAFGDKPRMVPVNGYGVDALRCRTEAGVLRKIHEAIMSIHYHEVAEIAKLRGKRVYYSGH